MIASITGQLEQVGEDRIYVRVGAIVYELLVTAADVQAMHAGALEEMTFHTLFYLQGDASGGSIEPRLIGFLRAEDKKFFEKFITVKGIGPRKALKALARPVGEIARAIESKDSRFLVELPEIGKRMAEQIVAELAGKVGEFAAEHAGASAVVGHGARNPAEEEALAMLITLGERRIDAEHLLERARQLAPPLTTAQNLVREMLRLRTVRG